MSVKDYDFVGESTIEKNGDDNPIVSYWVIYSNIKKGDNK
jgi:hypothetical protein